VLLSHTISSHPSLFQDDSLLPNRLEQLDFRLPFYSKKEGGGMKRSRRRKQEGENEEESLSAHSLSTSSKSFAQSRFTKWPAIPSDGNLSCSCALISPCFSHEEIQQYKNTRHGF